MSRRTPLHEAHRKLGAKLIEFGGWDMPVHYTGIVEEHHAVRRQAGLFDVSHMGQFEVHGPEAAAFLNQALTNEIGKLQVGQGQYTLMCNRQGGVVDDLIVYRLAELTYRLVVNASRTDADFQWLEQLAAGAQGFARLELRNVSDQFGILALQGPQAAGFIDACLDPAGSRVSGGVREGDLKRNQIQAFAVAGARVWLARTGYTGEDGFEMLVPAGLLVELWERILKVGQPYGLKPVGLGARDTLRLEACLPLYGHELDEQTTPLEAGLERFVAFTKPDFIGREKLWNQQQHGTGKRCVAFKCLERSAPPRPHYPIWSTEPESTVIGRVVSGAPSPTLGVGIGLGFVPTPYASPGTPLAIEVRGNRVPASVAAKPLYRRGS